jgi:hypothetical protein
VIEHLVTADMDDGQPLPPYIDDDVIWRVVTSSSRSHAVAANFSPVKPNGGAARATRS